MPDRAQRLLLASCTARSRATGMGAWAYAMAEALDRRGHRTDLWFEDEVLHGTRVGRARFLVAPVAVRRRLRASAGAFDAVVLHEPIAYWYARARRRDRTLAPLVVMCHNVESKVAAVMAAAERAGRARRTPWAPLTTTLLRHPLTDGATRLADAVACLSAEDRAYLTVAVGVPADRVVVITNGVDPRLLREHPPSRGAARRVLFVGGWLDIKGRRVLPELWGAVRRRRPDAELTVLGTGAGAEVVLPEFAAADRGSVRVVPHLADPREVRRVMDEHDLLVMPSLSEGSPLALLEAMACGLPAVAAARGGIPDLMSDGQEGRLFDPLTPEAGAAAVVALLEDDAGRRRCGALARARASQLSWDAAAARLEDAVRLAMHPPGP
jgi:glycosyltransferase involved in cell wall biosynthesis